MQLTYDLKIIRVAGLAGVLASAALLAPALIAPTAAPPAAESALLGSVLLALAAIDMRMQRLPDALTLPLAVAGLVLAPAAGLPAHIAAALAAYGLLAGIAWLFESANGYPGLGLGDAKMMAAGGAWLGPEAAAAALLYACLLALAFAGALRAARRLDAGWRLPFGPFLASGIWCAWLYGTLAPFAPVS